MAHEILGERAYFFRRPGWHGLGKVNSIAQTARQTLDVVGTVPVSLHQLTVPDMPQLVVPAQIILRGPIAEDQKTVSFGVVGPEYTLVTPEDVVMIWDEHVLRPVESMGFLRGGRALFITCKLPSFDVKGDEQDCYLMYVNWTDEYHASSSVVSPVRVVCMNTVKLAESLATESYRFVHDTTIKARMASWLSGIVDRALSKQAAIKEACELLASTTIRQKPEGIAQVLDAAYPKPTEPARTAPDDVMETRELRYELAAAKSVERQTDVLKLYMGAGTGMDHPALAGTYWGLYQSVVEYEDYRGSRSDISAQTNALIGDRASTKERAFKACLEVCKN